MRCLIGTTLLVVAFIPVAQADWDPTEPAKWVQHPDLTSNGVDVRATTPKVLADDFLCTETGPITDIHIWGSWKYDQPPIDPTQSPDPGLVGFRLSIHADIPDPDGTGSGFSMPGESLWERTFNPGFFSWRVYHVLPTGQGESWYDPNTGEFLPDNDQFVYQYNFLIPELDAFLQEGTADKPIVYWLDVEAIPVLGAGGQFGWKTSAEHWNDDAVWADVQPGAPPDWNELRYPSPHPYAGQSMDMAFVITPEPNAVGLLVIGLVLGLLGRRRRNHCG